MITSSQDRITELTQLGAWGSNTLHHRLAHHANERGDALAVADQPNRNQWYHGDSARLSFAELDRASDGLAFAFLEAGLQADDFLIVQLPNIVELVVCYYAASKLGIIVSPIPVQYGAHELRHISAAVNAGAMVTCDHYRNTELAQNATAALPDLNVLCCDRDLPTLEQLLNTDSKKRNRVQQYQKENPVGANHIATMCWTSGTTGTPKGVPRSHNMWFSTALGTATAGEYQQGDKLLVPFPLVNMAALGGFLFTSALRGCAVVLHHPFDAEVYLKQLADEQINFSVAPPAILNQLAKSPQLWGKFDFGALRAIGSGSAPLAPWMVEKFERDYKLQVVNFYGSNEGISLHSTPANAPTPEIRGTMFPRLGVKGMPWEGQRIGVVSKVADPESGQEITEPGTPGELLFSGPTVFDGYHDHDNADVFTPDHFFRTGDLVEICGDPPLYPYYRIVGRCKDIINRGGMKISPVEIDLILENFTGVHEAAVCAYADERLGEKICACLVLSDGADAPTVSELQDWLLEQGLAKFKLPERIEVMSELPRNPLGKVQRFVLTEQLAAD